MTFTKPDVAHAVTWCSWLLLLLQQVQDSWAHGAPWFIWSLKIVPLLMFVPGMLRDNLRSYVWLCFITLGYFLILVQRIFAQPGDPSVILGLTSVVVLFTAAMLYVRWRAQALRAQS